MRSIVIWLKYKLIIVSIKYVKIVYLLYYVISVTYLTLYVQFAIYVILHVSNSILFPSIFFSYLKTQC